MTFELLLTEEAEVNLASLEKDKGLSKRLKAVRKCLGYLEQNPRHPGLNSHRYSSVFGPNGEEIWEVYAENKTPAAYRVFWFYGPGKNVITVFAITPHP